MNFLLCGNTFLGCGLLDKKVKSSVFPGFLPAANLNSGAPAVAKSVDGKWSCLVFLIRSFGLGLTYSKTRIVFAIPFFEIFHFSFHWVPNFEFPPTWKVRAIISVILRCR